jgi:hypothetical protein
MSLALAFSIQNKQLLRLWTNCENKICCHFTTQNRKTNIKTNGETNTFPICLFVLSEQLVPSLKTSEVESEVQCV